MKTLALLVAASLLVVSAAHAQDARRPTESAPPPPGMNDPGVQPVAPPSSAKSAPPARRDARTLPAMHDDGAADAKQLSIPEVSVRQDGKNEVQEYRRNGQIYMVVVTPAHGVPYSYTVDPDGTRHMDPGQPPVRPTTYKVLEWGKPSQPADDASPEPTPADHSH